MYDIYVPLVELPKKRSPLRRIRCYYEKKVLHLWETPILTEWQTVKSGWIDVYENEGKTSGAYSFGSYDSYPYILLNYSNTLKDAFTLVHEMGHSMHSAYTRENQPFTYGEPFNLYRGSCLYSQ